MGGVLSFLPQIALLFFFLSFLEDSGYMSRAAFIMDRLLRRFGLSGKAFIPMLMGFGCSVPAIMGPAPWRNEKGPADDHSPGPLHVLLGQAARRMA